MLSRLLVLVFGLKRHGSHVREPLRELLLPGLGAAGMLLVDPHGQEELEGRLILKNRRKRAENELLLLDFGLERLKKRPNSVVLRALELSEARK